MNNICAFRKDDTPGLVCLGKCKYGNYCYKHRSAYLLRDGMICEERFTGMSKDYLSRDLYNYCEAHVLSVSPLFTYSKTSPKSVLFDVVNRMITLSRFYNNRETIDRIIMVQSICRGKRVRNRYKCQNNEDFFTFEELKDIPKQYYFSYVDMQGMRWGFDIRSLHKLIQMKYPNPYTTQEIPKTVIQDMKKKIESLVSNGTSIEIQEMILKDKQASIKQKTVDLFSKIEQSGYSCCVEWFLELNIIQLQELYKQLEDIWNYRAQLPSYVKRDICPPDGRLFTTPMITIMSESNIESLQELILLDLCKLTNTPLESNQKLGYMYIMIALGYVSHGCYESHRDWLDFV